MEQSTRGRRQVDLFNFSFLDILACVIGLLIFILTIVVISGAGSTSPAKARRLSDGSVAFPAAVVGGLRTGLGRLPGPRATREVCRVRVVAHRIVAALRVSAASSPASPPSGRSRALAPPSLPAETRVARIRPAPRRIRSCFYT